jgi:PAS domain S-box-containing protein
MVAEPKGKKEMIPKRNSSDNKKISYQLIAIALFMLVGMTIYESLKQIIFHNITIWESHTITILFSTVCSIVIAYFVLTKHKESEERYRIAIEHSNDGVVIVGDDGYLYVNQRFLDIFGYASREEVLHEPLTMNVHPDDRERVAAIYRKRQNKEPASARYVFKGVKRSGEQVFIEVSAAEITYNAKSASLAYMRDVTERERSEEALLASQVQVSEAMDLSHIVYWEFDVGVQTYVFNDPFYALYGTTAEQEGGYRMTRQEYASRFMHPDDLPIFYNIVEQNDRRSGPEFVTNVEHRIVRRDGDVRHILAQTRVIKDDSGHPLRIYGANQDITERKLVEKDREKLILELREALSQVKMLSGLLPICASCKKIRNDEGYWEQMEMYIRDHSEAEFSHGICPECARKLYPQIHEDYRET